MRTPVDGFPMGGAEWALEKARRRQADFLSIVYSSFATGATSWRKRWFSNPISPAYMNELSEQQAIANSRPELDDIYNDSAATY